MRHSAIRTMQLIGAVILVAATFAGQRAAAQAVTTAPTPVPAAPAGGIDPSKLPDIQGIHLGMSAQEAEAKEQALYPQASIQYAKFHNSTDPAWLSVTKGAIDPCVAANRFSCKDVLNMQFSDPPNKQVVITMWRNVGFESGKYPTADNVKAALIQKYGPNPILVGPYIFGWAYDEQGKPLVLTNAAGLLKIQCAGQIMEPQGTGGNPAEANEGGGSITNGPPLTQAALDQMMRNTCRAGVFIYVSIFTSGQLATDLDVKMSENSEDTRDYIAMEQYLNNMADAQKQQQIKHDQGIAAPKL
jgi:hypothetical protein